MKKAELREMYKRKRMSLSDSNVRQFSLQMHVEFLGMLNKNIQRIHVFLPIQKLNEPDTFLLLPQLWKLNIDTYTSVTNHDDNTLHHVRIDRSTETKKDKWGIPVPVQAVEIEDPNPDAVLVPLLYCDSFGNRIGYGKGFYDKFLANYPKTIKYGYGFFEPNETIDDADDFDIKMDYLILPHTSICFDDEK